MSPEYLLTNLFEKVVECRKAQKTYYAYKAPYDDPIKRGHLQEAQRREQDLDRLMVGICTARPDLAAKAKELLAS